MEEVLKNLGQRIRELRLQRGFTSQEKFAEYCGVDRAFMGHLETGRRDFRLSTIIKIAGALEVPMSELFVVPGHQTTRRQERRAIGSVAMERKRILEAAADLERTVRVLKDVAGPEKAMRKEVRD